MDDNLNEIIIFVRRIIKGSIPELFKIIFKNKKEAGSL
jgi:hypothetical protein